MKCLTLPAQSQEEIRAKAVACLRMNRLQEAFDSCQDILPSAPFLMHESFDSIEKAKSYIGKLPPMQFIAKKKRLAKLTIMFAGDEEYIGKFFNQALESVKKTNHEANIHLHAMLSPNTDPETLFGLLKDNVSISYEVYSPDDNAGYTTRRFIRIFHLLQHLNSPILCLDIDSKVVAKLDQFYDDIFKADIGIYHRELETSINQLIGAGIFYASPTKSSLRFLGFFINFIHYLEEKNRHKWFSDQMALLAADQWALRNSSIITIKKIPTEYMSWRRIDNNTLVVTYKGIQKYNIKL
jgi:hypothetical protein